MRSAHSTISAPRASIESRSSSAASGAELEAVGVHVKKLFRVGTAIFVNQNKRRTRNCIQRTPALRQALHEGSFACAEIALQANQIRWLEQAAESHADAAGLLRASAEEFKRVFIQNGHAGIIRQRMIGGKSAPFLLYDFVRLTATKILSDLYHAARERVLWKNAASIFWFRLMEFHGTRIDYRELSLLTPQLRKTFYYARERKPKDFAERDIEPIRYNK